jgi:amino acid transporter
MTTNQPQLKRAMGTPTLLMFGIAYMVPLTIFSTYGVVSDITGGRLPLAYIVTTIAMLFTALSYASIVRRLPTAGSAYGYARQAFGRGVGFVTGWGLMVDYMLLPMLNYMLVGLYVNSQFPGIPVWLVIVLAIALVTVLNVIGIEVVRNINVLLVAFQVLFLVFFVVLAVGKFSPEADAAAPFAVAPDFSAVVAGSTPSRRSPRRRRTRAARCPARCCSPSWSAASCSSWSRSSATSCGPITPPSRTSTPRRTSCSES